MSKRFVAPAPGLSGTVAVPPDKSISHRALLFLSIAEGTGLVTNLLAAEDVDSTRRAVRALGAPWESVSEDSWRVRGLGLGGLSASHETIDAGNSGTTARLLLGLLAGSGVGGEIRGDASLSSRPMERVAGPLREMGARIETTNGKLPARVLPGGPPRAKSFRLEVASAQVASAILLAGLFAHGETEVILPGPARDHTPRLLRYLGADVEFDATRARLRGPARLSARPIAVPGDPSSAAFFACLGAAQTQGAIEIPEILANPTRLGFLRVLREMGADAELAAAPDHGPEPTGRLVVRGGKKLRGTRVTKELAGSLIDEIPILAALAHFAQGETRFEGVGELRVKETDRLAAICEEFGHVGVVARAEGDALVVTGAGGKAAAGGAASARGDHRIAMSLAVLGVLSREGIEIEGSDSVAISYPGFFDDLARLAGEPVGGAA